jgi:hypothetical protein
VWLRAPFSPTLQRSLDDRPKRSPPCTAQNALAKFHFWTCMVFCVLLFKFGFMAQMGDWPTLYQLVLSAGSKRKPRKALEVPSPPLDPRALDLVEVPTMSVPVDVPVTSLLSLVRELLLYIRVRSFQQFSNLRCMHGLHQFASGEVRRCRVDPCAISCVHTRLSR